MSKTADAYPVDASAKKMKTEEGDEIHAVPARVSAGAHITGMHNYLSKWEESVNDPKAFWAKEAITSTEILLSRMNSLRRVVPSS